MPRSTFVVLALLCASAFTACGGGSSSPPATPSFDLAVQPGNVMVVPGSSTAIQITESPQNGFSSSVSVSATGLPSRVTGTPALPQTIGASGLKLTLAAASTAAIGKYTISLSAT